MANIRDVWVYANNIIHSARKMINEELKPLGLTSAEGNIILHLLTQGEEIRQEDIVTQLEISKPAVSRALDSLQKKGFVRREKDSHDKRVSRVLLTQRARDKGAKIEQIYDKVFATATQGVREEDIEEAVRFFALISQNFSQAGGSKDDK